MEDLSSTLKNSTKKKVHQFLKNHE